MTTLEQAKQLALEHIEPSVKHIKKEFPEDDLIIEHVVEFDDCWLFYINSKIYLETHDINHRRLGGGPVIVGKENQIVYQGGSGGNEEFWINKFREYLQNQNENHNSNDFL